MESERISSVFSGKSENRGLLVSKFMILCWGRKYQIRLRVNEE